MKSFVEGGLRQMSTFGGVRRVKVEGRGVGMVGCVEEALWSWKMDMSNVRIVLLIGRLG